MNQDKLDAMFHDIAEDVASLLCKKNHDYGDSFFKLYNKFGDLSTLIRLTDKVGRLETLIEGKEKVSGEPIKDVYRDVAGYCILSLVAMKIKEDALTKISEIDWAKEIEDNKTTVKKTDWIKKTNPNPDVMLFNGKND